MENNKQDYGFVYVLANESMPGLYKIGSSSRHPSYRVDELSRATGVPTDFILLLYADVGNDHKEAEAWFHQKWADKRTNENREFFSLTFDDLDQLINEMKDYTQYIHFIEYVPYIYALKEGNCEREEHGYL